LSDHGKKVFNAMGAIIGNTGRATPGFQEANIGKLYDLAKENIGAFCLRMRENRSVRLQMAAL
jgi:hypothetical protein